MKLIINKKYKDYFLFLLALIFLFINYYLKPKKIKIENKYYSEMVIAAQKDKLLQEEIFKEKLRRGIEIDKSLDKNETGLIGLEWSGITTTLGDIEAKRTSTNPDFAALLVKLFKEAGLKKGDIVAANFSSFYFSSRYFGIKSYYNNFYWFFNLWRQYRRFYIFGYGKLFIF